eukprot:22562-Pelagococcus_subviridis.AAC.6
MSASSSQSSAISNGIVATLALSGIRSDSTRSSRPTSASSACAARFDHLSRARYRLYVVCDHLGRPGRPSTRARAL